MYVYECLSACVKECSSVCVKECLSVCVTVEGTEKDDQSQLSSPTAGGF